MGAEETEFWRAYRKHPLRLAGKKRQREERREERENKARATKALKLEGRLVRETGHPH
ncbi:hypothetical protein LTR08_002963 [Meristemomyces frigidus]|nr:hypothetical protein LTR08_002963 [Meristemomyces frigidus]